jgi:class 3 adenylate cyclase/predicted ATPase
VLATGSPLAPTIVHPLPSAERRQLSVMFCDLVGSTELSVRLDPEDLREVIVAYQTYVAETVARFGGFVAKYMGDGVLVYFGYPRAHEHDAERAIHAGLALVRALNERDWPSNIEAQVRVGIATGLVVVGDLIGGGVAQEYGIVGETPHLAARLQALAEPNTVVIASSTRRLTGGLFDYRDLGAVALKGFAEDVRAWQVTGPSAAESRFEALREGAGAPLLGRDEELELLLRRWRQAKSGQGCVVLLSGEPGIGKSRLAAALLEQIAGEPHFRLRYYCSPHHTDSALHPIIAQVERAAGFARDDDPSTKLDKLEAMLSLASVPARDASLIADLLSLGDVDRRYPRLDLAPLQRKQKTLEALRRWVETLARHQPILAICEDAQWIDPTSLEQLDRTIELVPRLPVMFVVTFRPDFEAPWARQERVHVLALNRLGRSAGTALVGRAGGCTSLPPDIVEEILERADGVPLFIEELTKAAVEAGATGADGVVSAIPSASHHIPAALHASLTSRLDRLGRAKELAQIGAVIGRQFSYALLAAVSGRSESELRVLLDQLTTAGLVFRQGTPPQATFLFKHALVQDVAYASLLRSARQQLHARIATALEAEFPATAPEQLAQHWAQAGDAERAVGNWLKAGKQAVQRCANREAIAQLTKGLRMLDRLPHRMERDRTELSLQLLLAEALMADKGWTAPETRPCYARARELCVRTGDTEAIFPVLYGQFSNYLSRGEEEAHDLAAETLQLAQGTDDPALLAMAHSMLGMSLFSRGEFLTARQHLQVAVSLEQPDHRRHTSLSPGHNLAIASMWLGLTLLLLGHPEQATLQVGAGLRAARDLSNPHTLAHALALACRYHATLGDAKALDQATGELAALAAEHQFPFYVAVATIYRGWVLAGAHDVCRGIEIMREGMAAFLDLGAAALRPFFWAKIAVLSAAGGSARDGLELLDAALELVDHSGQRWCEAELHRSKGELLGRFSDTPQAESWLQRSLLTARRQHAKLGELRAACSLARLWRDQGKGNEAGDLLRPIYAWFTEGFDTPDLKEAKALLDALHE